MSGIIKGALGYIYTSKSPLESPKEDNPSTKIPESSTLETKSPEDDSKEKEQQQQGYLRRAVSGLGSGVYSVGSTTVGAGINSVKWIAGTTYSVGSGVVGTVGSVAGGTANAVAGVVGSGASAVISRVSSTKSKEHDD